MRRPTLKIAAAVLASAAIFFSGYLTRAAAEEPTAPNVRQPLAPIEPNILGVMVPPQAIERANEKLVFEVVAWNNAAQYVPPRSASTATGGESAHGNDRSEGAPSGDCSGFPVPGYVIQRESGGDPNAVNPSSGAFGCVQLMPMHFRPGGTCADLSTDGAGQRECAARLPASAWSATW